MITTGGAVALIVWIILILPAWALCARRSYFIERDKGNALIAGFGLGFCWPLTVIVFILVGIGKLVGRVAFRGID